MGCKTICTQPIVDEICARLAGGESLNKICKDNHMPDRSTVNLWIVNGQKIAGTDTPFTEPYFKAREAQGYANADNVQNIIERLDPSHYIDGTMSPDEKADALSEKLDFRDAQVMLKGAVWLASVMAPRKHGTKQETEKVNVTHNIMPVPVADSVDSWEQAAQKNQDELLNNGE